MLNDARGPIRLQLLVTGLGIGLLNGGSWWPGLDLGRVLLGLGVGLVLMVGSPVVLLLADRRVQRDLARGSEQLVEGRARGTRAIGRVVRSRRRRGPAWLAGAGRVDEPARLVVLEVVPDDGSRPRRVAALVPAGPGPPRRGAAAVLWLHETDDVALLEERAAPHELAAVAADPRWATAGLPSDRQVAGGYLGMVAAILLGVLVGVGVTGLLAAVW